MKFQHELHFDEKKHHYTWEGMDLLGCSSFLHEFSEPFDEEYWSARCAKKEGVSQDEMKLRWSKKRNNACDLGHYVHSRIEDFWLKVRETQNAIIVPDKTHWAGYMRAFQHFFVEFSQYFDGSIIPELQLAWPEKRLAGTVDWVGKVNGQWTIIDWKTNEEIKKTAYRGAMMKEPFSMLPDCNFGHYSCQLSVYMVLLEEALEIQVKNGRILHLKPSGAFDVHKIIDAREAVYKAIEDMGHILELIEEKREKHAELHSD